MKTSCTVPEHVFTARWPCLYQAGFTASQLEQVGDELAKAGRSAELVAEGLDVFRSLSRTGHYRCPKGFLTHAEQAVADTQRKKRDEARKTDDEAFRAWWDGLTQDMRDMIDENRLGPSELWRKAQWRKNMGRG